MNRFPSNRSSLPLLTALLACCCIVTGCASSPASNFYILEPMPPATTASAERRLTVRVGPIEMAEYLDRPQIITRTGTNSLKADEFNRWIEPLDSSFLRALTTNLGAALNSPKVQPFSTGRASAELFDYQVLVNVTQFDVDSANNAVMTGQWGVVSLEQDKIFDAQQIDMRTVAASSDYADRAAALSQLVSQLAEKIAADIRAVDSANAGRAALSDDAP